MRSDMDKYINNNHKHSEITDKIIKAYYHYCPLKRKGCGVKVFKNNKIHG